MNSSIKHLAQTASKETKIILGLMSGTSLDGIDLALCQMTGSGRETAVKLLEFKTVSYPKHIFQKLQKNVSVENAAARDLTILNSLLGDYYGRVILETLDNWQITPAKVDCIASHGQTIYHAPASPNQPNIPHATLQMGDGDHIAHKTAILTVSDFRQKHTAAGGEGSPMVSLVEELLFQDEDENRILLNIGGIANLTYLPKYSDDTKIIATDTGPGNTLINKFTQHFFGQPFDKD